MLVVRHNFEVMKFFFLRSLSNAISVQYSGNFDGNFHMVFPLDMGDDGIVGSNTIVLGNAVLQDGDNWADLLWE